MCWGYDVLSRLRLHLAGILAKLKKHPTILLNFNYQQSMKKSASHSRWQFSLIFELAVMPNQQWCPFENRA
jgi:hypothetical protein